MSAAPAVNTHTNLAALPRPGLRFEVTIGRFSVILVIGMSNEPESKPEICPPTTERGTFSDSTKSTTIINLNPPDDGAVPNQTPPSDTGKKD